MDEVVGKARVGFHVHDLVARPAPGADEIDPRAVGHAASPRSIIVVVVKQLDHEGATSSGMAVRLLRQAEKSARCNPHLEVVGHRSRHDFFPYLFVGRSHPLCEAPIHALPDSRL
jgi:hypothetical protein